MSGFGFWKNDSLVDRHQEAGEQLSAQLDQELRRKLAADPFSAIPEGFPLNVAVLPAGGGDADCSCDGAFYAEDGRIVVAETPFSRRSLFTCLHELGHHLVWNDSDLLSRLFEWDPENRGRAAQERVCDAFAAAILVPSELVRAVLGGEGVQAKTFLDLYKKSSGSREACAVRLAQHLSCDGHVMLARPDGTALFTASTGQYGVGRGVMQGTDHITVAAGKRNTARQETFVQFRSGRRMPMLGDAICDGRFVYAVLAEAPQWKIRGLSIHRDAGDRPEAAEADCTHCGSSFQTFETACKKCDGFRCPDCGRCECAGPLKGKICSGCFLELPSHLFVDGSDVCSDCR